MLTKREHSWPDLQSPRELSPSVDEAGGVDMYQPLATTRMSPEEDDRRRGEYHTRSPAHGHPYSPTNGTHPQSPYNRYSSRPSSSATMAVPSAISPRPVPPPSPKLNGSVQQSPMYGKGGTSGSTRYDPLSEHREGSSSRKQSHYDTRSPIQVGKGETKHQRGLDRGY